jgi:glutaredoxin
MYRRRPAGSFMQITIYSKPDCHLCDDAKAILKKLGVDFKEINIQEEPEAYEKYKWEIPVIFIDDVKVVKGRVDEGKLRKALSRRVAGGL